MEEEEQKTQVTESEDTREGDKPESTDPIERANEAAERLEAANKERERLLKEEKQLEARRILGGKSDNGEPQKKEESASEYVRKVLSNNL